MGYTIFWIKAHHFSANVHGNEIWKFFISTLRNISYHFSSGNGNVVSYVSMVFEFFWENITKWRVHNFASPKHSTFFVIQIFSCIRLLGLQVLINGGNELLVIFFFPQIWFVCQKNLLVEFISWRSVPHKSFGDSE